MKTISLKMLKRLPVWISVIMLLATSVSIFARIIDDLIVAFLYISKLAKEFFKMLGIRQIQMGHMGGSLMW